jgi:hypothetical protein
MTRLRAFGSRKYLAICSPYAGRSPDSLVTAFSPELGVFSRATFAAPFNTRKTMAKAQRVGSKAIVAMDRRREFGIC